MNLQPPPRASQNARQRIIQVGTDDPPSAQYGASRRKERGEARRKMLTRLAKLNAKLTARTCPAAAAASARTTPTTNGEPCPTCDNRGSCLACDPSGLALMSAALRDPQMRQLAATVIPTVTRARGRPLKGAAPQLENQPGRIEDAIAEAVARYVMGRPNA